MLPPFPHKKINKMTSIFFEPLMPYVGDTFFLGGGGEAPTGTTTPGTCNYLAFSQ